MQPVKPFSELLVRLWRCISNRRQKQFGLLLILMVLTSFAEILSIGAVLPFLGMLTSPGLVFEHPAIQPFVSALGLTSHEQLSLPLTVLFSVAAVTAGVMRLLLLWSSGRLSFASGAELSLSLYRRTLYQPYAIHITRNSSEVIDGILTKVWGLIYGVILPILSLVSAGIMLIAILIALLYVSPLVALAAFGGFGLIYASVIKLTRNRLMVNSQVISIASPQLVKSLQEGLGGIRDVLIDGSQATYCEIYQSADRPLRQAQANNYFISGSPRFATEALGTLFIAGLAYAVSQQPDGITKAIPVLGALALGAQRLLPVLQQAYGAWASIRGGGHRCRLHSIYLNNLYQSMRAKQGITSYHFGNN